VDDRGELIEMLGVLDPRVRTKAIVVQPHISKVIYDRAQQRTDDGTTPSVEALRMELLEALLNIAHAGIVGNGSDLFVIGSVR
jgi:ribosomal protein S16